MIETTLLRKPLFGSVYGVRNKYVFQALNDPPLKVRTQNHGDMIIDPKWVMNNCEIIETPGLYPDNPMKMYKIYLFPKKDKEKELERMSKDGIFG